VAGTLGGWQDEDDTGWSDVPGQLAVFDGSGATASVDPREIDDPVVELAPIT